MCHQKDSITYLNTLSICHVLEEEEERGAGRRPQSRRGALSCISVNPGSGSGRKVLLSPIPFSRVGRMEKDDRASSLFNFRGPGRNTVGVNTEELCYWTTLCLSTWLGYNLHVFPEHHGLEETEETQSCPPIPYPWTGEMTDKYMVLTNFKHELSALFSHVTL